MARVCCKVRFCLLHAPLTKACVRHVHVVGIQLKCATHDNGKPVLGSCAVWIVNPQSAFGQWACIEIMQSACSARRLQLISFMTSSATDPFVRWKFPQKSNHLRKSFPINFFSERTKHNVRMKIWMLSSRRHCLSVTDNAFGNPLKGCHEVRIKEPLMVMTHTYGISIQSQDSTKQGLRSASPSTVIWIRTSHWWLFLLRLLHFCKIQRDF